MYDFVVKNIMPYLRFILDTFTFKINNKNNLL